MISIAKITSGHRPLLERAAFPAAVRYFFHISMLPPMLIGKFSLYDAQRRKPPASLHTCSSVSLTEFRVKIKYSMGIRNLFSFFSFAAIKEGILVDIVISNFPYMFGWGLRGVLPHHKL